MEALEFARIQRRMCAMYGECHGCPMEFEYCRIAMGSAENDEEIISIVEAWGKDHPAKTRQSELLKIIPNVPTFDAGVIDICPSGMDTNFSSCPKNITCNDCKKKYWAEEVE